MRQTIGNYRLLRCIGRDSEGTVYEAADAEKCPVTLTTLHPRVSRNQAALIRFYQQARLAMRLDHPHLIEGLEVGCDRGIHFFVREHLQAETLHNRVDRRGPLAEREAIDIIRAAAGAVAELHKAGVVHRGIAPTNLLLTTGDVVKLAGLRSARLVDGSDELPRRRPGLPTLQFLSPQQIRDESDADVRSDVYSLGATLYTLVTGKPPFAGRTITDTIIRKMRHEYVSPERIVPGLSRGLVEVIRQCLFADPARRPADVAKFIELLDGNTRKLGGYELLEPIGRGSTGIVYRGRSADGRKVAVKLLDLSGTDAAVRQMRFYQEAKLAMQIDHPNVVKVEAVGEENGQHYLVMEYVEGENLAWTIKNNGRLDEQRALAVALEIARGLSGMHRLKLVHRDVKPSNVLITPDGGVKLIDLGLARPTLDPLGLTVDGHGLGTPQYMAPEQFSDAKNVGPRADIYSLGVTLYVMLTGEVPFSGRTYLDKLAAKAADSCKPVEELAPFLSDRTARLVRQSMQSAVMQRPLGVRQFMQAVVSCQAAARAAAQPVVESSEEYLPASSAVWHVLFVDRAGQTKRVRGRFVQVERWLRAGKLPHDARACFGGNGPYLPLAEIPTFRAFFRTPHARPAMAENAVNAAAIADRPVGTLLPVWLARHAYRYCRRACLAAVQTIRPTQPRQTENVASTACGLADPLLTQR